ncbi:MAG: hypothetical protein HYY63_05725 [Elusimicrobia bacterium]|nr:hypothetical protein [Elusimicrobiota bacterium]MBI2915631.1 hypothetical protein [Elusimicrobiota bacterium]MBI3013109.1 hypothetical protein [Elusimicrobiota bacterium]MBI4218460.1 hypothetical protein [Elusimicrobiota bacterium]
MPTPMDAMLGLVTLAIGLLILVTAFLVQESKKRVTSYILAGVVAALGGYHFVASEVRVFEMRRRIANIQRQQQVNLEEIQKRLKETQEKAPAPK